MKKRVVVICPGRGTYNAGELGYLGRFHGARRAQIEAFDAIRTAQGQTPLLELDSAPAFDKVLHTRGDNASALIFASSVLDAKAISDEYEVVGVTGNSMGWYSALAVAGAATPETGFTIANTMGAFMQRHLIGGQSLYPFVDDTWREMPGQRDMLVDLVRERSTQHTVMYWRFRSIWAECLWLRATRPGWRLSRQRFRRCRVDIRCAF